MPTYQTVAVSSDGAEVEREDRAVGVKAVEAAASEQLTSPHVRTPVPSVPLACIAPDSSGNFRFDFNRNLGVTLKKKKNYPKFGIT